MLHSREPGCLCDFDTWSGSPMIGGYARCPVHSPWPPKIPLEPFEIKVPESFKPVDFTVDSIVQSIIKKFETRAIKGKLKYGTDLDRKDLGTVDWIEHAQDELMDAILYLEKLKHEFNGNSKA